MTDPTPTTGYNDSLQRPPSQQTTTTRIDIVPFGTVPTENLHAAATALESVYDCDTTIMDPQPLPENAPHYRGRDQLKAGALTDAAHTAASGNTVLGITEHDLGYRRRNFVFGLAYLGGSASVISTYRLHPDTATNSTHGVDDRLATRIGTEAVHEIGHTFGLEHCKDGCCAMCFSPTVREVDLKNRWLCTKCQQQISVASAPND